MRRRFRINSVEPDASGHIDLSTARRHLEVLRAGLGDVVYLFDGRGTEVEAEIKVFDEYGTVAIVRKQVTNESESDLECWLVQAIPIRIARMDTIIRQVTELGVHRVVPGVAERSQQAKAKLATMQRRANRWSRIAEAAAEQSCRTQVPKIDVPCGFDDLDWGCLPRPMFIADPEAGSVGRVPVLRIVSLLVGPEGGWTEREVNSALAEGAHPFGLGPRVLRADTAGVVAITLFQALWGDLSRI